MAFMKSNNMDHEAEVDDTMVEAILNHDALFRLEAKFEVIVRGAPLLILLCILLCNPFSTLLHSTSTAPHSALYSALHSALLLLHSH